MNRENILSVCISIIGDILANNVGGMSEETELKEIEGYDSLAHVSITTAIQDEFNVRFSIADTLRIKKIGDFADLIVNGSKNK